MTWRQRKKTTYGIFYLFILALLLLPVYFKLKPAPSCLDGKLNQGEEQVDCGGPCLSCNIFDLENVKVISARTLNYSDGSLDLIGEIENPNGGWGLSTLFYRFIIEGVNGEKAEVTGTSFIYPRERKFVYALNREPPAFSIKNISLKADFLRGDWHEMGEKPVKIDLLSSNISGGALEAEIINGSEQDYQNASVLFLLYNDRDDLLAAISSEIGSIDPLERKTLRLTLPPYQGLAASIVFQPDVNVFK